MSAYFIRRILWLFPVLFVVALITFSLMHAAPGGPWDRDLSSRQVDAGTQKVLNAWISRFGGSLPPMYLGT
ncbi:MAG TPA: hypothetical protein PLM89_02110 [Anaerolineales bacterium]|nr:hypothetical protein [Anaerolineales bacterium]